MPPALAKLFCVGEHVQAILARQRAETLSSVLYPDDRTYQGKELRLKQQHFFVSATMQVTDGVGSGPCDPLNLCLMSDVQVQTIA